MLFLRRRKSFNIHDKMYVSSLYFSIFTNFNKFIYSAVHFRTGGRNLDLILRPLSVKQ